VYENAFSGLCADVIYTIGRGSFEQDVLITGRWTRRNTVSPPTQRRLQIFTEFYQAPQPDRIRRPIRVEQRGRSEIGWRGPISKMKCWVFGEFVLATAGRVLRGAHPEMGLQRWPRSSPPFGAGPF
jgi:hypothetical protein